MPMFPWNTWKLQSLGLFFWRVISKNGEYLVVIKRDIYWCKEGRGGPHALKRSGASLYQVPEWAHSAWEQKQRCFNYWWNAWHYIPCWAFCDYLHVMACFCLCVFCGCSTEHGVMINSSPSYHLMHVGLETHRPISHASHAPHTHYHMQSSMG